jgi:hypothetical protein
MTGYAPTSDWKRNKLRERLLTKGPFPELIDFFSRPFVMVSAKAVREGMGTYRPHVPLEMKMAAGWPARLVRTRMSGGLQGGIPVQVSVAAAVSANPFVFKHDPSAVARGRRKEFTCWVALRR